LFVFLRVINYETSLTQHLHYYTPISKEGRKKSAQIKLKAANKVACLRRIITVN